MSKHKAIGANPLDALVPAGRAKAAIRASKRGLEPAGTTPRPQRTSPGPQKERLTVHLPIDLIDRVKNAVYWTPGLTLAGLSENALTATLAKLEKDNGKPFPKRKRELKGGRPLK